MSKRSRRLQPYQYDADAILQHPDWIKNKRITLDFLMAGVDVKVTFAQVEGGISIPSAMNNCDVLDLPPKPIDESKPFVQELQRVLDENASTMVTMAICPCKHLFAPLSPAQTRCDKCRGELITTRYANKPYDYNIENILQHPDWIKNKAVEIDCFINGSATLHCWILDGARKCELKLDKDGRLTLRLRRTVYSRIPERRVFIHLRPEFRHGSNSYSDLENFEWTLNLLTTYINTHHNCQECESLFVQLAPHQLKCPSCLVMVVKNPECCVCLEHKTECFKCPTCGDGYVCEECCQSWCSIQRKRDMACPLCKVPSPSQFPGVNRRGRK